MKKTAVLSHVLPPSPSGQAVILYRILSGIPSQSYFLISGAPCPPGEQSQQTPFSLMADSYFLPPEPRLSETNVIGLRSILSLFNLLVSIGVRTRNIIGILHREPAECILACTGDLADLPAGFLASRLTGVPFYAYLFDDYVYQWMRNRRRFAKWITPMMIKHSSGVIVPNEFLGGEYHQRYGITATLIRNPCDRKGLQAEPLERWPAEPGKIKIVYTGAIYHANADCFRNLIQAMDTLTDYPLELHIFTAQTQEQLREQGIDNNRIHLHSHIPYDEIFGQQQAADILFLPLAFESPIPEVIRTSAPGKMGEYLASGRPILVHAPADSYLCWYFRSHQCGAVADKNNPAFLAGVLKQLLVEKNRRTTHTVNARICARADFDPAIAQSRLMKLLNIS